jgi:hypothetical protein
MKNSFFIVKKICVLVLLILFSISMLSISECNKCDFLDQFLKAKGVPNTINQNNDKKNGIILDPKDDLFILLCNYLQLDKPMISILGCSNLDTLYLLKVYAEDLHHEDLTVVLFDDNCNFIDKLSLEKPVNGDQLGHDNGYSIEWHYNADVVLQKDTIITLKHSVDVKVGNNETDTIYKKYIIKKYLCDMKKGFQMVSEDSIKFGKQW